jgi:ribosome biogenesis GTPase A
MGEEMHIQWFPGHMTKARRMLAENMKLVDAVCEIIDARIAYSSRNPDIDELAGDKPRLVILNRVDQADPAVTALWREAFKKQSLAVLETDSRSGKGVGGFSAALKALLAERKAALTEKGQAGRPMRAMVLGIPNVGKSTFINKAARRKAAKTSDKPGVTRGKQWITVDAGLELLDTPGILWPRFENKTVGENLAFTGAIRDEITDLQTLASRLMERLKFLAPEAITGRYKIAVSQEMTGFELLEAAARKRGFLVSGGQPDLERMAAVLLDEFRGGLLGRISLERPEDFANG